MNNEELNNLSDKEKLLIFNLAVEQAQESNKSFDSQIGAVINAFSISKKEMNMAPKPEFVNEPLEMNMAPRPEFVNKPYEMNMAPNPELKSEPFEMNMAPRPEFVTRYNEPEMNMAPKVDTKDTNDGPVLEPIDTQKVEIENQISF